MTRDLMICKRILLQVVQSGGFQTNDRTEACHVALMLDRGYVEASIKKDCNGCPVEATIGRITAQGYDAYDREFDSVLEKKSDADVSPREYYNMLTEIKRENEKARDKMVAFIASSGIGLGFAVASYLHGHQVEVNRIAWLIPLALWASTLVGLLVSDHLGSNAIDECIEKMNNGTNDVCTEPTSSDKRLQSLNIANCMMAVAGIIAFIVFMFICLKEV